METRHIMNTFQIFTYAYIISELQAGYAVPSFFLSDDEWQQLATYMPLQSEQNMVYAAVLTVPGFEMSASEQNATQSADWIIDERMDGAGMYRGE